MKTEQGTENTYTKLACSYVKPAAALSVPKVSLTKVTVAGWEAADEIQVEKRCEKEGSGGR